MNGEDTNRAGRMIPRFERYGMPGGGSARDVEVTTWD
jgi:hypothetical protein